MVALRRPLHRHLRLEPQRRTAMTGKFYDCFVSVRSRFSYLALSIDVNHAPPGLMVKAQWFDASGTAGEKETEGRGKGKVVVWGRG